MGRPMRYRVLLPPNYSSSSERYPTLYLLHGLFGDYENWTTLGEVRPLDNAIVIMPEGEDGWYCNGESGVDNYEKWLVDDLLPLVDKEFRTDPTPIRRGIAGNSMGGFGALKIALRHGHLFSFAASTSGAFEAPGWTDGRPAKQNWDEFRSSILRIFGVRLDSRTRLENDLYTLVAGQAVRKRRLAIYFDCGRKDDFIEANRRLSRLMLENGVEHRFDVLGGAHDWEYWAMRVKYLARIFEEHVNSIR